MNEEEQRDMVGSLAALFGEQSMEAWLARLLDERRCMDCKKPLDDEEGTMEFHGCIPRVDLIGHLCAPCWEWREVLRQGRQSQGGET